VPSAVNHVQASLGAGGATATVDDVNIAIHWDQTLLSNLAQVADAFGVGATIRQLSPVLSVAGIDVDLKSVQPMAESPQAETIGEAQVVASVTLTAPAAEQPAVSPPAAEQPAVEQPAVSGETAAAKEEQPAVTPAPQVCVVSKGESLWTCWEKLGRSAGTGKVWVDWKKAAIQTYHLTVTKEGLVIVQPGDQFEADLPN
ncbi:MAG: hypothetical protein D6791_04805, partial [Chloroflexi bacterium]